MPLRPSIAFHQPVSSACRTRDTDTAIREVRHAFRVVGIPETGHKRRSPVRCTLAGAVGAASSGSKHAQISLDACMPSSPSRFGIHSGDPAFRSGSFVHRPWLQLHSSARGRCQPDRQGCRHHGRRHHIKGLRAGRLERVRLSGIDCPGSHQAFGTRAKQSASRSAFGREVKVVVRDTDRYGRTVGEVILPDGRNLNPRSSVASFAPTARRSPPSRLTHLRQLAGMFPP